MSFLLLTRLTPVRPPTMGAAEKPIEPTRTAHSIEADDKSSTKNEVQDDARRHMPEILAGMSDEELNALEKKLRRKLDCRLLPMLCLIQIMNYLDRCARPPHARRLAAIDQLVQECHRRSPSGRPGERPWTGSQRVPGKTGYHPRCVMQYPDWGRILDLRVGPLRGLHPHAGAVQHAPQ